MNIGGIQMELLIAIILIVIGLGGTAIINGYVANKAEPIKEKYDELLEQLKNDSNNAELKKKVLEVGREYYSTCRTDGKLTIYDEQAIQNDITAHCIENNSTNTIYNDIERLAKLKEKGILTEEEFLEKKQELLRQI